MKFINIIKKEGIIMKINKKLLSVVAIGTLGLITFTPVTNAATSEANVSFTSPTSAPDILNPDNPEEVIDPDQEDGKQTNEVGVLTLDFVSHLYFGPNELSLITEPIPAKNTTTPFAQVTDLRGTGAGWQLVAELGEFTNQDGAPTLPGSTITLNNGQANANGTTLGVSSSPEVTPSIILSNDTVADVTKAIQDPEEENAPGMGTWLTTWMNENITLDIPNTVASEGEHTATITWTLYDAPSGASGGSLVDNPTEEELQSQDQNV